VVIQKIRSKRHYSKEKNLLRKSIITKRKRFHSKSIEHPHNVANNLIKYLESKTILKEDTKIACYWPIGSEIDTRPSLAALNEYKILISIASTENNNIIFRHWEPNEKIEINKLGTKLDTVEIKEQDIIICPLIGFDKNLNRLGRGGGYYDKILQKYNEAIKIGFAYSIQEIKSIPMEEHDICMDTIITEKFIYNSN